MIGDRMVVSNELLYSEAGSILVSLNLISPTLALVINTFVGWILISTNLINAEPKYGILFNLALADALTFIPYYWNAARIFYGSPNSFAACQFSHLLWIFFHHVSIFTVCLLNLDMYMALVHPFRHIRLLVLKKRYTVGPLCASVWLLSAIITMLGYASNELYHPQPRIDYYDHNEGPHPCFMALSFHPTYWYVIFLLGYVWPVVWISYTYVGIYEALKGSRNSMRDSICRSRDSFSAIGRGSISSQHGSATPLNKRNSQVSDLKAEHYSTKSASLIPNGFHKAERKCKKRPFIEKIMARWINSSHESNVGCAEVRKSSVAKQFRKALLLHSNKIIVSDRTVTKEAFEINIPDTINEIPDVTPKLSVASIGSQDSPSQQFTHREADDSKTNDPLISSQNTKPSSLLSPPDPTTHFSKLVRCTDLGPHKKSLSFNLKGNNNSFPCALKEESSLKKTPSDVGHERTAFWKRNRCSFDARLSITKSIWLLNGTRRSSVKTNGGNTPNSNCDVGNLPPFSVEMRKYIHTSLLVVVLFLACWTPFFIRIALQLLDSRHLYNYVFAYSTTSLVEVNCVINPILYCVRNQKFQECLKPKLSACYRFCRSRKKILEEQYL